MKYVALLRGINAGKNRRVEMKKLRAILKALGHVNNISTYINSGNAIFESEKMPDFIRLELETVLKKEFGFDIPTLVKSKSEMKKIAAAIPTGWENDATQRTDVAYLFDDIDSPEIVNKLPIDKKFIDIRYIKGAIFWNVSRKNYNKSHLNKLIGHESYKCMTVRNVNTARFLAD